MENLFKIILLCCASSTALSADLIQFKNGQVANADDVNANFVELETRVEANKNNLLSIQESYASSDDEAIFSLGGIDILKMSRTLSDHYAHTGIYERKIEVLQPQDDNQEIGRFITYGELSVIGDNRRSEFHGIGPAIKLTSSFPEPANNRHFYINLGDTWNAKGSSTDDVIFHSWDSDYQTHIQHMIFKPNGNVGIGTLNPNSSLEVNGYIQLSKTGGSQPPAADCNESSEYGRMKVDEVNALLYICTSSGWVSK